MIGIVNIETGALVTVVPDAFADDIALADDQHTTVAVPEGYPDNGLSWDAAARDFVSGWETQDASFHYLIDQAAGRFRKQFITTAPGQEMTYLQKRQEAEAYVAGADPLTVPMLAAEADAMGVSIADLAATVIAKSAEWEQLGAAIEGLRMQAKKAVTEADTIGAKALAAKVDWAVLL